MIKGIVIGILIASTPMRDSDRGICETVSFRSLVCLQQLPALYMLEFLIGFPERARQVQGYSVENILFARKTYV